MLCAGISPATLLDRLGRNIVIKQFTDSKTDFEKELTCGFKILAGIYAGGVKKKILKNWVREKTLTGVPILRSWFMSLSLCWNSFLPLSISNTLSHGMLLLWTTSDSCALNWWFPHAKTGSDGFRWVTQDETISEGGFIPGQVMYEYINGYWRSAVSFFGNIAESGKGVYGTFVMGFAAGSVLRCI